LPRSIDSKRQPQYGWTKKEALEKLDKRRQELAGGISADASSMTVSQWLAEWLKQTRSKVAPNTYKPYETIVRLHLVPHLGPVKLGKLKAAHVQALYNKLAELGVSAAMQRKAGGTLTIALNVARAQDLIAGNPAEAVRKPKTAKPEFKPLDPDELAKFLEAAKADRLYAFYWTMLDTGARPGELWALEWADVDFERGCITINKSLEQINVAARRKMADRPEEVTTPFRIKGPKTTKGRRLIHVSAETMQVLIEHRKGMLAAGLIGGPVFCNTIGGYLMLSDVHQNSFQPILARAGIQEARERAGQPRLRLYDLRHTSASLLFRGKVPAKVVSERLGHSTIVLTMDTYSHLMPGMQEEPAGVIGGVLSAAAAIGVKLGSNDGARGERESTQLVS
jgi:integrase